MHVLPSHRSLEPTLVRPTNAAPDLQGLVRSAEPAVVFSSLAHLCVPAFSDACTIDIVEQGQIAYRIAYHRSDTASVDTLLGTVSDRSVSIPFTSCSLDPADPGFVGVITHRWRSRRPTVADRNHVAALVRRCVRAVAEERRDAAGLAVPDQAGQPKDQHWSDLS